MAAPINICCGAFQKGRLVRGVQGMIFLIPLASFDTIGSHAWLNASICWQIPESGASFGVCTGPEQLSNVLWRSRIELLRRMSATVKFKPYDRNREESRIARI